MKKNDLILYLFTASFSVWVAILGTVALHLTGVYKAVYNLIKIYFDIPWVFSWFPFKVLEIFMFSIIGMFIAKKLFSLILQKSERNINILVLCFAVIGGMILLTLTFFYWLGVFERLSYG